MNGKLFIRGVLLIFLLIVGCTKSSTTVTVESPISSPSDATALESPLSTDGPLEVYSPQILFQSDRDGNMQWYIMDPSGSNIKHLNLPNPTQISGLNWIPELRAFVAILNSGGKEDLYLLNIRGDTIRRLTSTSEHKGGPVYSSAAQMFAFPCVRSDLDICMVSQEGGDITNLTGYPSRESAPDWSLSGEQILFVSNRDAVPDVWLINRDGTGLTNLTNTGQPHGSPSWSPDGSKILFTSQRDMNWEVYVMDYDGQNPVNLTNHGARDLTPKWSPDGNYIAFRSDRAGNEDLFVANADGTEVVNITSSPQHDEYVFGWIPNAESLFYVSRLDGDAEIYTVSRQGTETKKLTDNSHDDFAPQWVYSE
jgi:Tol biopolymer transport system component